MINPRSTNVHDELDFAAVRELYERAAHALEGCVVASPFHLYSVETLRDRHQLRTAHGSPTDVFVFAQGEPIRRHVTKVGGLPYWPADVPWPSTADGDPYRFLAQINFADSLDLLPPLPGNLLSIFTEDENSWQWDDDSLELVWQIVDEQDLITPDQLPDFTSERRPFNGYGVICRTADYSESEHRALDLDVAGSNHLAVFHATKIGGVPHFLQGRAEYPGTFLAQLASIQPAPYVRYPWVNRAEPYELGFDQNGIYGNDRCIGDMGSLYLFLQDDGDVWYTTQCH